MILTKNNILTLANDLPWEMLSPYEGTLDTPEANEELHRIIMRKYHYDEYKAGML